MKCEYCNREMAKKVGCTHPVYDDIPGCPPLKRIPYGQEPGKFHGSTWQVREAEEFRRQEAFLALQGQRPEWILHDHCSDCGTPAGQLHHPGCDMEDCPNCGWQAISCACMYNSSEEELDDEEKWTKF